MLRSRSLIGEVAVMIVTRQYAIIYDAVREVYKIQSEEVPICPKCGAVMAGHGSGGATRSTPRALRVGSSCAGGAARYVKASTSSCPTSWPRAGTTGST